MTDDNCLPRIDDSSGTTSTATAFATTGQTPTEPVPRTVEESRSVTCCVSMPSAPPHLRPKNWGSRLACWWLNLDFETWKEDQRARKASKPVRSFSIDSSPQSPTKISTVSGGPSPTQGARSLSVFTRRQFVSPQLLSQLGRWDFDVFKLARDTNGSPLYTVTTALLEKEGLLTGWKLDQWKVENYLYEVEKRYLAENPYHNCVHAADVVQASYVIVKESKITNLSKLEMFSLIIGAAVHDVAHPGLNNDFMVRSRSKEAQLYNDKSVNENGHAFTAFQIMENEHAGILDGLSWEEFRQARKFIINMVLSTDMATHFDLIDKFHKELDRCPDVSAWEDKDLLLQLLLHIADIANPARPFELSSAWAEMVVSEFLRQGDKERESGLEVSACCDRNKVHLPVAQKNFIKTFLKPTLHDCRPFMKEEFMSNLDQHLGITLSTWEKMADELENPGSKAGASSV